MGSSRELFLLWLCFLAVALAVVCCEPEYEDEPRLDTDTDSDNYSDSAEDFEGDGCPFENLTRPCCNGNGRQVCQSDLTWSECECGNSDDAGIDENDPNNQSVDLNGNNRDEIEFEWEETDEPIPGNCKAGLYEGNFRGTYSRGDGIAAWEGEVPITGMSITQSGISMRLKKSGNGEIFRITDGILAGNVYFLFQIFADIEGKLDCSTARLESKVSNGLYFFPSPETGNLVKGWIKAEYDKKNHAFINGTWEVTEPEFPLTNYGRGTWRAEWKELDE
ncbi:MAG: hypothetical protein GY847_17405 [Proteobacteria bacterium]|nr:hypothetical protein [Pseudomonadota bacterium]